MKRRLTILAVTVLAMVALIGVILMAPSPALADGAKQIKGTALDGTGTCDPQADGVAEPTTFPLLFPAEEGGLNGCLYTYAESSQSSPSGTYRERGHEIFVSHDPNNPGTFETTYLFQAKFDENGHEIWGRCEHPITAGTGTGAFKGVTGRINIQDNVEGGVYINFPYKGHLRF
jgi:hypothetical protein